MEDLIKALTILLKYGNRRDRVCCGDHDTILIYGIDPAVVSAKDVAELKRLGFDITTEYDEPMFSSSRYGSA